jgi:transcriptional regulator with XRE-family HTH domain
MNKANPVSQTQLAKASGVHPQTVNKFLRGVPIRSDALARLQATLKRLGAIDLAELDTDESDPS